MFPTDAAAHPRSGDRVSTGIETDRKSFDAMPVLRSTMHCWVCGGDHVWSKRWAEFVDETALPSGMSINRTA